MATPPTEPQSYAAAPQAESHLWDYVHVLLRRRRVVLAIFTAVFALATLRTLLTRPVYEGTAQILIERADPSVLNFKEVAQVDSRVTTTTRRSTSCFRAAASPGAWWTG